jgi:hypothetical protein
MQMDILILAVGWRMHSKYIYYVTAILDAPEVSQILFHVKHAYGEVKTTYIIPIVITSDGENV